MAEISTITVNGTKYDIKDATARNSLSALTTKVNKKQEKLVEGKGIKIDPDTNEISVEGSSNLSEDLVASVAIGSVTVGKKYVKGTPLEDIIRAILVKEEAPGITLTTDPATLVYDIVTQSLSTIKLTADITKKTYQPTNLKYYIGSTVLKNEDITSGGSFNYVYTPGTPIKTDTTFKVTVTDGKLTNTATKTIKFVPKSYWGIVPADVETPVESDIKGLANFELKTAKGLTYSDVLMTNSRIVYAYPKSFGLLTSIVSKEGYDYMTSYTRTETKVDNIDYYVYTLSVPASIQTAGYKQIFA